MIGRQKALEGKKKFNRRSVVLIIIWVLLLVISLSFLSILASLFARNPQGQSISSPNWAGYIITKSSKSNFQVIAVNASWIVPKVNASEVNGYSSAWIGISGQLDKTLIQVGTGNNVVNGQASYNAWYELLPSYAVQLNSIIVSPGDTIVASINLVNSETNDWTIKISDATTGQAFSDNVVYNSTRSSAEWIIERPKVANQTSTLADFGNITFTDCHANVNNAVGPIVKFSFTKIQMSNNLNVELASTSTLTTGGTSFTVNYLGK